MKKITFILAAVPLLVSMGLANAQVTANGSATVSGSATAGPAIIVPPPTEPKVPPPAPTPIQPGQPSGFIQFNNLSVTSVSASNPPAEIVATDQMFAKPMPMPMMGASSGAATGSAGVMVPAPAPTTMPSIKCYHFDAQASANGNAIACPVPPVNNASYRIEVTASTQLILRDRTTATLANFAAGDQINVYGYYNTDGSVQAYLIRDISKPVVTQTIQLNNVSLVSVSGTTVPATLAVTQEQTAPCYTFNGGATKMPFICPMGLSSFSANAGTQAATAPTTIAQPIFASLHKYAVTVDAKTILLDNNRTQISLSNLSANDHLNVYGETSDNGQTITADIIRDLSIPAKPSSTSDRYTGTVTSVNADGSFTIQTNGAPRTPVQVGATVMVVVP